MQKEQAIPKDRPLEAIIFTETQRDLKWIFEQGISKNSAARFMGVSRSTFDSWVRGVRRPREQQAMALRELAAITRLWLSKGHGIDALQEAIEAGDIKDLRDLFAAGFWSVSR